MTDQMIERYDCETDHQAGRMVENDDGEWVRYDDLTDILMDIIQVIAVQIIDLDRLVKKE